MQEELTEKQKEILKRIPDAMVGVDWRCRIATVGDILEIYYARHVITIPLDAIDEIDDDEEKVHVSCKNGDVVIWKEFPRITTTVR
jgi:hypothetical protein